MARVKITKKTEEVESPDGTIITLGHLDVDITKDIQKAKDLMYDAYKAHWDLKGCECNFCEASRIIFRATGEVL
jgi:hypothetical protein